MSVAFCRDCLYYEPIGNGYGFCRRWPPMEGGGERVYSGRTAITGHWYAICDLDWCGEFTNRPWRKGDVEMEEPPPEPDPPTGIIATPGQETAYARERDPFGDPA